MVMKTSSVDYIIDVRGSHKLFHVNMLTPYYAREEEQVDETSPRSTSHRHANTVAIIDDVDAKMANDGFHIRRHTGQ